MRKIKFRGKRLDTGEWVFGSLILYRNGRAAIAYDQTKPIPTGQMVFTEVDTATVGQWTGLHDREGTEIYEGDWLRFANWCKQPDKFVEWNNEYLQYALFTEREKQLLEGGSNHFKYCYQEDNPNVYFLGGIESYQVQAIGTIHDKGIE